MYAACRSSVVAAAKALGVNIDREVRIRVPTLRLTVLTRFYRLKRNFLRISICRTSFIRCRRRRRRSPGQRGPAADKSEIRRMRFNNFYTMCNWKTQGTIMTHLSAFNALSQRAQRRTLDEVILCDSQPSVSICARFFHLGIKIGLHPILSMKFVSDVVRSDLPVRLESRLSICGSGDRTSPVLARVAPPVSTLPPPAFAEPS